ncbi:MAG: alpha-amylase [Cyclobacteriaceae bacterium]
MKIHFTKILSILLLVFAACQPTMQTKELSSETPFLWENATVYFLLTDRFVNADTTNDMPFERQKDGAILRSFEGGDLAGITQKIEEGYFNELGIDAIWFNPPVEQIHSFTDEGTGKTYGYHGYWARDWTSIDPNFGTMEELETLVKTAHDNGIRILLDVVVNHTGPVTDMDSQWPDAWVRTAPKCTYKDDVTTIACTLVQNLPDIRTDSNEEVELPQYLLDKWESEGRLEKELAELDEFFERTGHPRAPRYYIMKWLTDYVRELGIDGYRVDTAKHTEASIWAELQRLASQAFEEWKKQHPEMVMDDQEFFMLGEVYNYFIGHGRNYPYNDTIKVDFFANGFNSLINFDLRSSQGKSPEEIYSRYSDMLNNELDGKSIMSYLSSHDDDHPFDRDRTNNYFAAKLLMLAPGQVQIYYGDESARPLSVEGAVGDANLRSLMNWGDQNTKESKELMAHWRKLGQFRQSHPAIGAGVHKTLSSQPFVFSRTFEKDTFRDAVVIAWDHDGSTIDVSSVFENGTKVRNFYTGEVITVKDGEVSLEDSNGLVLLETYRQ